MLQRKKAKRGQVRKLKLEKKGKFPEAERLDGAKRAVNKKKGIAGTGR